jgi:chaperonin GroEL
MFDSNGYSPKDLVFGEDGRSRLIDGIVKISNAVKSTLGPGGNTVLIESPSVTRGITVTKDGVTVARAVDLFDPVENLAVRMMKEAAERTATVAGDGTTTSIILTEALALAGTELLTQGVNRTEVLRHLHALSDNVVASLRRKARKVTERMLVEVATISANNDRQVGKIIADVYKAVGRSGIVTVEKSLTPETYVETTKGLKLKRGWSSNLFINDHKSDTCVFDDVSVMVSDMEITNILQIENVLKPIIAGGRKLLIIAPCSQGVLNTFAANVMKGNMKVCVVAPPSFGYRQHELMHDIAVSVGATYFSEKTGDDLSMISFADLGHANKIIASQDDTVIVKSTLKQNQETIDERVAQLWAAHAAAKKKSDKDFLLERIASLTGGIGVIYVGGNTDLEQKELYDRVEDAVCAVRSALEEGILPGAGKALFEERCVMIPADHTKEQYVASLILSRALERPLMQILENAGIKYDDVYSSAMPDGYGYNVKTGYAGDLFQMGVVDPLKVTRSALQNAVSVASTILSTNAIITMGRSFEISNVAK